MHGYHCRLCCHGFPIHTQRDGLTAPWGPEAVSQEHQPAFSWGQPRVGWGGGTKP